MWRGGHGECHPAVVVLALLALLPLLAHSAVLAGDRKRGACPSCQLPPAAGPSCLQLLQGGPLLLVPGPGIIPPVQHLVENIYTPSLLQSGRPGLWAGTVCDTRQNVMCLALSEQTHFWFYQPKIFLSVNHEGNK